MQVRQLRSCSDRARRVQTSPGPRTRVAARCAGGRPARDRVESRPRTGIDCTHPRIAHCPEPDRARTGAGYRGARRRRRRRGRVAPGPRNDSKHKTADPHATAPPALGAYGARRRRRSAHPRTTARRYTRTRATRGGAQGDCGGHHTATPSPRLTGPDTRSGSRVPRTPTVLPASTYAATGYTYSASCRLTLTSGRSVSATHALCPCYSQCLLSKLSVYSLSSAASTF